MGFNKVIVLGNLTRDPELKYTPAGTSVTTFGLAINRRYKQGDDLKEEVCFLDVTLFGKTAELASQYLAKGRAVLLEGRLRQQRWETDGGEKRSKHELIADHMTFIGGKPGEQEEGAPGEGAA